MTYHDVVYSPTELDADHDNLCYLNYVETILNYETVTPEIVYRKGNQVCLHATAPSQERKGLALRLAYNCFMTMQAIILCFY